MADLTKLGSAEVDIGLNLAGLRADMAAMRVLMMKQIHVMQSGFNKAGTSVKRLGNESVKAGHKIKTSFRESIRSALSLERMISRIAFISIVGTFYAAGRAIKQFFDDGIKGAIDFERQMANVFTMLDKTTKVLKDDLTVGVVNLAVEFGQTTETLTKGLYDILSASVEASQALDVLAVSAKAATAGMTNTATSADAITGVLNAYSLSAEYAGQVSDILFATVKRGKITFPELAKNIGKVVSSAGQLGIGFEQLSASIATMTRQSIRPREAMTGLNRLLLTFARNSKVANEVADKYGFTLRDIKDPAKGLTYILKKLRYATDDEMVALAGSVRAFKAVAAGINDTKGQLYDYNLMLNSAGMTQEAYNEITDTTSFKLAQAKESFKKLERQIGSAFLPTLGKLAEALTKTQKVNLSESIEEEINSLNNYSNILEDLLDKESKTRTEKELLASTIGILQSNYPEYLKNIDMEKSGYQSLIKPLQEIRNALHDKLVEQLRFEEARKIQEKVVKLELEENKLIKEKAQLRSNIQAQANEGKNAQAELNDLIKKGAEGDELFLEKSRALTKQIENGKLAEAEAGQLVADADKKILSVQNKIVKKQEEINKLGENYESILRGQGDANVPPLPGAGDNSLVQVMQGMEGITEAISRINSEYNDLMKTFRSEKILGTLDIIEAKKAIEPLLEQLKTLNYADWVAASANFKQFLDGMKQDIEELDEYVRASTVFLSELFESLAKSMSNAIGDSFSDMLTGAKSWRDSFKDIFKDIWQSFADMISKMIAQWLVFQALSLIGIHLPVGFNPFAAIGGGGQSAGQSSTGRSLDSGYNAGTSPASIINNFNPNNNINAKFSQRDMAFIYNTGKKYANKTSL